MMATKVELKDVSAVKKTLEVEVEPADVEKETQAVLRGYAQKARIPGFRKGKAPLSVIRHRFAKEVEEDVRDRLISRLYREATEERGLRPLGGPVLEELTHEPGQPFRFRTSFEVLPEFTVKDYRGVEVRREKAELADKEVDEALEELRQSRARLVAREGDGGAVTGDVLVADIVEAPEGAEPMRREKTMIEVGSSGNLPAFNEALLDARPGARLEFPVDFPAEHPSSRLAGRTVRYEITVHEVKRREVPELDDEFAKDLGDFDSLAALTDRVRQDLQARKMAQAEQALRQAVLDKVLVENPIPLPEVLVEEEVKNRLEDLVRGMILRGVDPRRVELDWKELRERQEQPARKTVHAGLVLDAVARQESIEVERAEVERRLKEEAARAGERPEAFRAKLKKAGGLEALRNQMVREKSLDLLTTVANIQNVES